MSNSSDPPPSPADPPPVPGPQRMGDQVGMRLLMPVGRSGWAIAAGYLGLFALLIIPAPLALIISIVAIWDINRSAGTPAPKYGMGRAVFGLIMGLLGTVVLVMIFLSGT